MTGIELWRLACNFVLVVGWFVLLALFISACGWAHECWRGRQRKRKISCATCKSWDDTAAHFRCYECCDFSMHEKR